MSVQLPKWIHMIVDCPEVAQILLKSERRFLAQDLDGALSLLKRGLSVCHGKGAKHGMAVFHNNLAIAYERKGLYNVAVEHYEKSLESSDLISQKNETAVIYANLGNLYLHDNRFKDALNYLLESALLFIQLEKTQDGTCMIEKLADAVFLQRHLQDFSIADINKEYLDSGKQLGAIITVARIYVETGEWERALTTYNRVLESSSDVVDDRLKALVFNDQAFILQRQGKPTEAIAKYREALKLSEGCSDTKMCSTVLNNLGLAYKELGRLSEAARCLKQSLEIKQRMGNKLELGNTFYNLASLYLKMGKLKLARRHIKRAVEIDRVVMPKSLLTDQELLEKIRTAQTKS